jgi:hypothetical protein
MGMTLTASLLMAILANPNLLLVAYEFETKPKPFS